MNRFKEQKTAICLIYVVTMFIVALDGTIINTAMPAIARDFHIAPAATSTINIGYLVSLGITLPVSGYLGNRFGTKKVLFWALVGFTISSALCALAGSLPILVAFRMLQGASGGILTPICMALLFKSFSKEERGKVARSLVLPIALAPAAGPLAGGILVDSLSWEWIFIINLPIGAFVIVFSSVLLRKEIVSQKASLDLKGLLLSTPAFSLLLFSLSQGPFHGWGEMDVILSGAVGALFLVLFLKHSFKQEEPLLDLSLFGDRLFRSMGVISSVSVGSLMGVLYILPLLLQNELGLTAMESGSIVFPEALGLMAASRLLQWTLKQLTVRQVMISGLVSTMCIFTLVGYCSRTESLLMLRVLMFLTGLCLGHTVVCAQYSAFHNMTAVVMSQATTLYNVLSRFGSAIGLAAVTSLLMIGAGESVSYESALIGAVCLLLVPLVMAVRLREKDLSVQKERQMKRTAN